MKYKTDISAKVLSPIGHMQVTFVDNTTGKIRWHGKGLATHPYMLRPRKMKSLTPHTPGLAKQTARPLFHALLPSRR